MPTKLLIRISRLEAAAADCAPVIVIDDSELATRLESALSDLLTRGILKREPGGGLAAGDLPEPGHDRSMALLLTVISDQAESETVKICD